MQVLSLADHLVLWRRQFGVSRVWKRSACTSQTGRASKETCILVRQKWERIPYCIQPRGSRAACRPCAAMVQRQSYRSGVSTEYCTVAERMYRRRHSKLCGADFPRTAGRRRVYAQIASGSNICASYLFSCTTTDAPCSRWKPLNPATRVSGQRQRHGEERCLDKGDQNIELRSTAGCWRPLEGAVEAKGRGMGLLPPTPRLPWQSRAPWLGCPRQTRTGGDCETIALARRPISSFES